MISKTAVGIAVGIASVFVGYCVYFDQKRRSDPDFKKKLRERKSPGAHVIFLLCNTRFLAEISEFLTFGVGKIPRR